jgi:hypothetical protein
MDIFESAELWCDNMVIKGATVEERGKRKLMLDTVAAIKRGGDYSMALSVIFDVHGNDKEIGYRFSNVAARAMQINISPLVMLRNGSKRMAPSADSRVTELSRLYRRLDISLALAEVERAERTIIYKRIINS